MSAEVDKIVNLAAAVFRRLEGLDPEAKIDAVNRIRTELHQHSPMKDQPIDLVLWEPSDRILANDYNPNSVAPPEMRLLQLSIQADGYTQPVVGMKHAGGHEIVDGFHRTRVGKEVGAIRAKVMGRLPIVSINASRQSKEDRIAATIRHNRARGKHQIDAMSDIVVDLARRGWSDAKIGAELGMDADEVLRLKQITGLADIFADKEFSQAWEMVDDESEGQP